MASTSNSSEISYVFISNIPGDYHSSDLRNYFSQFLESNGFECFHFRHRPEGKRTTDGCSGTDNTDKPSVSDQRKTQKTFCCVAKLYEHNLVRLMKMYHRKHWLDRKGESISKVCRLSKIKVISAASKLMIVPSSSMEDHPMESVDT